MSWVVVSAVIPNEHKISVAYNNQHLFSPDISGLANLGWAQLEVLAKATLFHMSLILFLGPVGWPGRALFVAMEVAQEVLELAHGRLHLILLALASNIRCLMATREIKGW